MALTVRSNEALNTEVDLKAPLASPALVNPTINGIAQSGYTGFKNYIINGRFDIWQRGTSFASGVNYYSADRWRLTGHEAIISKNNGLRVKYNDSDGGNNNFVGLNQTLETLNTLPLVGKTVTLSVTLRKGTAFEGNLRIGLGIRSDSEGVAIGLQTSKDVTSEVGTDYVTMSLSYVVHASALSLGVNIDHINTTTINDNNYFEISHVQLEEGSVATLFEVLPVGLTLALCKRYYQTYGGNSTHERVTAGYSITTATGRFVIPLVPEMRGVPTLGYSALSHWAVENGTIHVVTSLYLDQPSTKTASINFTSTGLIANGGIQLMGNGTTAARLTLSAEL